jgi:uncharacterized protein YdeI (YjbR/CyaY-like superfamily)
LEITFDPIKRTITPHHKFIKAIEENNNAKIVFDGLSPSKRHEIIRYISFLKTEKSIDKNIKKAIYFLLGNGKFVGRNKP